MAFSLAGRTALVTGATGHLGTAISRGLAEAGAAVLINGRDREKIDRFVSALRRDGHQAEALPFDVTDGDRAGAAIAGLDRLDILVNNATTSESGTFLDTPAAAFAAAASGAAGAVFALTIAALPLMRRHGGGSVVNIASMYGTVSPVPELYGDSGYDNPPQYGAAKAGMLQLTRYLACHLAPDGIRVNAVSPGPFPPLARLNADQPEFLRRLEGRVPMRRIGRPEEVAGAVVFLASDAASYITGVNLPVDGGWTAW